MTDDEKHKKAIESLTSNPEMWIKIKKILQEDIRSMQDLIIYLDKIVQERANEYSKLN